MFLSHYVPREYIITDLASVNGANCSSTELTKILFIPETNDN
jgi:hypothetical protein